MTDKTAAAPMSMYEALTPSIWKIARKVAERLDSSLGSVFKLKEDSSDLGQAWISFTHEDVPKSKWFLYLNVTLAEDGKFFGTLQSFVDGDHDDDLGLYTASLAQVFDEPYGSVAKMIYDKIVGGAKQAMAEHVDGADAL